MRLKSRNWNWIPPDLLFRYGCVVVLTLPSVHEGNLSKCVTSQFIIQVCCVKLFALPSVHGGELVMLISISLRLQAN